MSDAPCPFCGNSEIRRSTLLPGRGFCENCGAEGPWSPAFDGDWNTRVLPRAVAVLLEALLEIEQCDIDGIDLRSPQDIARAALAKVQAGDIGLFRIQAMIAALQTTAEMSLSGEIPEGYGPEVCDDPEFHRGYDAAISVARAVLARLGDSHE